MVKGLNQFKKHFAPFSENYVLIGGVACLLAMEKSGVDFRVTKDIDIVLCLEALNQKFVEIFWQFIEEGKYQCRQRSTGKKLFYRFHSPANPAYPEMLELFSRKPDGLSLKGNSHLTPIPVDEEISSLSAILLHEDYYRFIHEGKQEIDGLPVVVPSHLIPLKARAWIDLSRQSDTGISIDGKNIRKHRNDIIRLYQLLPDNIRVPLPKSIQQDMQTFLERIKEIPIDVESLGVKKKTFKQVLASLEQMYALSGGMPLS